MLAAPPSCNLTRDTFERSLCMDLKRSAPAAVLLGICLSCSLTFAADAADRCVGLVCIDVVDVGDPGNAPDADTGLGAVDQVFAIGKYEINVDQYLTFLNAVAATPAELPPGKREAIEELWQQDMFETHSYVAPKGVVARSGNGSMAAPYVYREIPNVALDRQSPRRAILNISWFAAARFANWLHNGGTATSNTEDGAYTLSYRREGVVPRNPGARWWIPSLDEWYKAAYHDPSKLGKNPYWTYPTRSDSLPVAEMPPGGANSANYNSMAPDGQKLTPVGAYAGTTSHYGTHDQAGLMWEWSDTPYRNHDGISQTMALLGGSWSLGLINLSKFGGRDYLPEYNDDDTGFRLATTVSVAP